MLHSSASSALSAGEYTSKLTQSIYTNEPPVSPADLADLRRRNPKQQNSLTSRNCLSLRDNAACCIPLRDLRNLRENTHPNLLNLYTQTKPQYLPLISQIYADETQKPKTTLTSPTCLSLRYNAACCIPLRYLRYLRENIHMRVLNQTTQKKPNVSRRSRRLRRQTTKQQNSLNLKLTVFLCEIMQLAAFLCVICVICGRINTQAYSINPHRRNPNVSRRFRR